jgi:hypothetical protein
MHDLLARLKSCPDAKPRRIEFFSSLSLPHVEEGFLGCALGFDCYVTR